MHVHILQLQINQSCVPCHKKTTVLPGCTCLNIFQWLFHPAFQSITNTFPSFTFLIYDFIFSWKREGKAKKMSKIRKQISCSLQKR